MFDDEAGQVKSPANPNSQADPQEGTPLLPNKLAEEDQIRLRFVLPLHLLRPSRVFFFFSRVSSWMPFYFKILMDWLAFRLDFMW